MIVVSLVGLKKCGKTTTAEALIREFKSRGYKVGGVKWMVHSQFTIDVRGKDTWRHRMAGADFVISMSEKELAFVGNRPERPTFEDVLAMVPKDTDIIIAEGLKEDLPHIQKVVIARGLDELEETFKVREVRGRVIALSGILANEVDHHPEYPAFNCTEPTGAEELADLILKNAEGMG